jgi:folate-binding protein YgfZ
MLSEMRGNEHGPEDLVREALARGACLDRSGWRLVELTGADARGWLNDLVTAGVEDLAEGRSLRSLLLSHTGRIRADVDVVGRGAGLLLVQDPSHAEPIDALLDRYVLSSDVAMAPLPGPAYALPDAGAYAFGEPPSGPVALDPGAEEVWRVVRGDPRFGVDLDGDSLPAEGRLERTVDTTKGCFLGQESVAKVRNLGHPPRLVLHLEATGPVRPGDPVGTAEGGEHVGVVTSAVPWEGRTVLLARARWAARDASLTAAGLPLRPARTPARP